MKIPPSGLMGVLARLRIPDRFWSFWGARILSAVVMSAIVAICLKPFETGVREFVDANVQLGLLTRLGSATSPIPICTPEGNPKYCISVIGIDDNEHRNVFQQRSPLDPEKLRELFDAMLSAPPRALAIDLDLSPASPDEWPARRRLFESLQKLARVSPIAMVCPQAYTLGDPSALDQDWVALFGSEVNFASPDLSENGLYFDRAQGLAPLGVVLAELSAAHVRPQVREARDWHSACLGTRVSANGPKLRVIRPAVVDSLNFSQALLKPDALTGRLVLLGGKWGTSDQFQLRGQTQSFYGVGLHAWVAATELSPLLEPPKAAELVLDVLVGLLSGLYFAAVWGAIVKHKESFALRSVFYFAFLVGALFLPVAWVMATARLAEVGVVLGTAGMILSAAADSFLSAHEGHLESEHQTSGGSRRWWVYLLAWGGGVSALALTLLYGEIWPVCLAVGAMFGLLIAYFDAHEPVTSVKPEPEHAESIWDLLARLVWLLLKLAALWLALNQAPGHEAWAIWGLLAGFVMTWSSGLWMSRRETGVV